MITLFSGSRTVPEFPADHLLKRRKAKEGLSIPVFASLNALHDETWIEYAKKIEETGVDGLELNFYSAPNRGDKDFSKTEEKQVKIPKDIKAAIKYLLQ